MSEGCELLGGYGGMLPWKMSKNYVAGDANWHTLGATETRKDVSFFVSFRPIFIQI